MTQEITLSAEGYDELAIILRDAFLQASEGKGRERHANDLPFDQQPMQTLSDVFDSDKGMAFQVVKKLREGLDMPEFDRLERELLGSIVYTAGIILWHKRRSRPRVVVVEEPPLPPEFRSELVAALNAMVAEPASEIDDSPRQQAIAQNGNDGAVYAELIANGVKAGHCATCGIDQTQLHYVGCPELKAPPEFQAEVDATISEVFGADPDGWVEWRPAVDDRAPRPSGLVDYITRSGNAYTADSALLDWTHRGSDLDIVQYRPAK